MPNYLSKWLYFSTSYARVYSSPFSAIIGLVLFIFTVYYAYVVWGRIPFAATNLVCATTAVKSNMGLSFLAYLSLPIMLGWSCWWLVSFVSTVYVTSGCDGQGNCTSELPGILVFALLLSYHWTFQVIKKGRGGSYHRRAHLSVPMVYVTRLFGR